MEISDNHVSVGYSENIKKICKPLFKLTSLNYFAYIRVYKNGKLLSLPTNPEWHQYYFDKNYHDKIQDRLFIGKRLWKSSSLSNVAIEARDYFDIDNKFEISTSHPDYIEIFSWGSKKNDSEALDLYLNQECLLLRFAFYFKEHASTFINDASNPSNLINLNTQKLDFTTSDKLNDFKIFMNDSIKKITIDKNNYLNQREVECYLKLLQGKTSKEIGDELFISDSTVRTYVKNIKSKLYANSISDLFRIAKQIGVSKLIESM